MITKSHFDNSTADTSPNRLLMLHELNDLFNRIKKFMIPDALAE